MRNYALWRQWESFEKGRTYCCLAFRTPCWFCISLWRCTPSLCCPGRSSASDPCPAAPEAPSCCYITPGSDRVPCSVPGSAEGSTAEVCWGSDPGSPRPSSSSHGRCPRWHKWTGASSESRSWGGERTVELCPDASFCPHLFRSGSWNVTAHRKNCLYLLNQLLFFSSLKTSLWTNSSLSKSEFKFAHYLFVRFKFLLRLSFCILLFSPSVLLVLLERFVSRRLFRSIKFYSPCRLTAGCHVNEVYATSSCWYGFIWAL